MDLQTTTQIKKEYLEGSPNDKSLKKNIADKYNISHREVTSIVEGNPQTNALIEAEHFEIPMALEQRKIHEVKMALLELFIAAAKDGLEKENRHLFASDLLPLFDKIDNVQRLNEGKATAITETKTTETKYDISEILANLKTPEEKMAFIKRGVNQIKSKDE